MMDNKVFDDGQALLSPQTEVGATAIRKVSVAINFGFQSGPPTHDLVISMHLNLEHDVRHKIFRMFG